LPWLQDNCKTPADLPKYVNIKRRADGTWSGRPRRVKNRAQRVLVNGDSGFQVVAARAADLLAGKEINFTEDLWLRVSPKCSSGRSASSSNSAVLCSVRWLLIDCLPGPLQRAHDLLMINTAAVANQDKAGTIGSPLPAVCCAGEGAHRAVRCR
jgi:hypothetical protein